MSYIYLRQGRDSKPWIFWGQSVNSFIALSPSLYRDYSSEYTLFVGDTGDPKNVLIFVLVQANSHLLLFFQLGIARQTTITQTRLPPRVLRSKWWKPHPSAQLLPHTHPCTSESRGSHFPFGFSWIPHRFLAKLNVFIGFYILPPLFQAVCTLRSSTVSLFTSVPSGTAAGMVENRHLEGLHNPSKSRCPPRRDEGDNSHFVGSH